MKDLKITVDQIKNYLGTGLKYRLNNDYHDEFYEMEDSEGFEEAFKKGSIWELKGFTDVAIPSGEGDLEGFIIQHEKGFYMAEYHFANPMFYRLSGLDKHIPELGFVPYDKLGEILFKENPESFDDAKSASIWFNFISIDSYHNWPYIVLKLLFLWNFWPFGDEYFEQGLVIDKLKLK